MTFKILKSHRIDAAKWDNCVAKNKAPIYCRYMYLHLMAASWVGIVINDYEAIIPICIRKKYFIKYSYTPAFIQQLGFVGNINIDFNLLEKEILKIVKYGDIHFNHTNSFTQNWAATKTNFILNLNNNYKNIYDNYKTDLKNNLKKAAKQNLIYSTNNDVANAVLLYKKMYSKKMSSLSNNDYNNFIQICNQLTTTNNCIVRQIEDENKNVLATTLLLIDNNRIYNVANSINSFGRKTEANHLLIDSIIKEFANSHFILDFEGSDLQGVKTFYKKFGVEEQPYFHWHFNKLPWYIQLIKK
jgi:hypothetical protein